MLKPQNFLIKIFNYLFLAFFGCLFISLVFFNISPVNYNIKLQIFSAVLVFIIFMTVLIAFKKCKNIKLFFIEQYKMVLLISILIIAFLQVYIICTASTSIGWDVGRIIDTASSADLNKSRNVEYFSHYPNNLFLLLTYKFIIQIIGSSNVWSNLDLLSAASVDISAILVFFACKRIINIKFAYISYLLSICTFSFFAWILVPYSDTLAMPFTIAIFLIYLNFRDSETLKSKIFYSISIAFLTFVGYLIKPTVVIILIAIMITMFIFNLHTLKNTLLNCSMFFLISMIIFGCNSSWQYYINNQNIIKINSEISTPMIHFYMMGLKSTNGQYGGWNQQDVQYTFSYKNQNDKKDAELKVIKERLNDYGMSGYLKFLFKKACWVTSEGDFYWGREGNFAKFNLDDDSSLICRLFYTNGSYHWIYRYLTQGLWIMLMFLIICPLFISFKNNGSKNIDISLIRCTLLGIILFNMLFEARSRYLILYLPLFCILASYGFMCILNKFKIHKL